MSTFDKLLTSAAVDSLAARVTSKGTAWKPALKECDQVTSEVPLVVKPFNAAIPSNLHSLAGRRRDRMTLVGLSEKPGAWVVRCDCGNYEHRTRPNRWLSIQEADACRECRQKFFVTHGKSLGDERTDRERRAGSKGAACNSSEGTAG
jgi:hypothetical protein